MELRNIRSYEKENVEFPEGSVLLSGDVGSGKSTLLLAIEFALFGIKRGELSGEALLKRGKKNGTVKLDFTLDGKDVTIERNLKRVSSGVRQESGYITIDGLKREGTALELKATVLELLGYPQELVQKQKSFLYRYTVYTPQEQMKEIIKADREKRLDTLRKVFGVNKYKIIRENIEEFLKSVRRKKRDLEIVFRDLDKKKEELNNEQENLNEIKELLKKLKEQEDEIQEELEKWKKEKKEKEEEIKLYNKYDKALAEANSSNEQIKKQIDSIVDEMEKKEREIRELEKLETSTELSDEEMKNLISAFDQKKEGFLKDPHGIDKETDALLIQKEDLENKIEANKSERTQVNTRKEALNESIQKLIEAGNICPVCGKELEEEHRQKKIEDYKQDISKKEQKEKRLKSELEALKNDLKEVEGNIEENRTQCINEIMSEVKKLEEKRDDLRKYHEKMKEKQRLDGEIKEQKKKKKDLQENLDGVEDKIRDLTQKLEKLEGVQEQKEQIEGQIEDISEQLTEVQKKIAEEQTRKGLIKNRLEELNEDIEKMERDKKFEKKLGEYESWFEEYLMELAGTIERHFMLELRHKFDPLFRNWFYLLIEDESLSVRIDDEFAPIIEQDGYQAEYENLSGGESAAVALAYRLALNKVINTLVEEIKSNDIIILDEPTDGFSNDQLDKIRDIIAELNIPQTIIVSHEPKVESYVDNIISVYKEGGLSRIQEGR